MKKKGLLDKSYEILKKTMFREYSQPEHIRKMMNYCPQEVIMVSIPSTTSLLPLNYPFLSLKCYVTFPFSNNEAPGLYTHNTSTLVTCPFQDQFSFNLLPLSLK